MRKEPEAWGLRLLVSRAVSRVKIFGAVKAFAGAGLAVR